MLWSLTSFTGAKLCTLHDARARKIQYRGGDVPHVVRTPSEAVKSEELERCSWRGEHILCGGFRKPKFPAHFSRTGTTMSLVTVVCIAECTAWQCLCVDRCKDRQRRIFVNSLFESRVRAFVQMRGWSPEYATSSFGDAIGCHWHELIVWVGWFPNGVCGIFRHTERMYTVWKSPHRFDDLAELSQREAAPILGEHTVVILANLGYSRASIEAMLASKAAISTKLFLQMQNQASKAMLFGIMERLQSDATLGTRSTHGAGVAGVKVLSPVCVGEAVFKECTSVLCFSHCPLWTVWKLSHSRGWYRGQHCV